MKLLTTTALIAALCSTAAFALISDFNGSYTKVPTYLDPWCGRSIEIEGGSPSWKSVAVNG